MNHLHIRLVGKLTTILASLILASTAHADVTKFYGDWYTQVADDGSFVGAITSNLNGDMLAEYCYSSENKHCEWRFSTKNLKCIPGVKTVVLLNSGTFANPVATDCIGELVQGTWTNRITQWSTFESVVINNQEVAFAIAANEGTSFKVFRFSLRGMTAATASIGGAINPNGPNAGAPRVARDEETL